MGIILLLFASLGEAHAGINFVIKPFFLLNVSSVAKDCTLGIRNVGLILTSLKLLTLLVCVESSAGTMYPGPG